MCPGAKNKQSQNSTSTYTPTAAATSAYNDVLGRAQSQVDTPYNPAMDKSIASLNPQQQAAFSGVNANVGSYQPYIGEATDMTRAGGAGLTGTDIGTFMNPYTQQVIDNATRKMGEQDALQTRAYTANQVSQSGLGGSGYFLGKAQLANQQGQNRNDTIGTLNQQGWDRALAAAQADKTRGLQAGQQMAGLGQLNSALGYQDTDKQLAVGNQQQANTQAGLDAAQQNAQQAQLWDQQQTQWLAGITSGTAPLMGGTTKSTGTATTQQGKGVGNMIGAGITLAGMASDERVKENAQHIGYSLDGQKIYKFNYKGDPRTQMGLMAQDVEQGDHPEAVSEIGGVKHVNYDTALQDAGEGRADGGGVFPGYHTAMPWASINPAQATVPQTPDMKAPAQEQGGQQDYEGMFKMGQKAGSGLESLFGGGSSAMPAASSPAGGAMAASGLQGLGSGGFSIGSLFGFADGGGVDEFTPEEMNALEQVESGGRDIEGPMTYLGERAQGPRQVMPSTAKDPGFGVRPIDPNAPDRVAENRRFSNDYSNAMLRRYKGDKQAARVAYNGGPKRADAWLAADRDDSVIPRETADYYKKIEGVLGKHPQGVSSAPSSGTDGGGTAQLVQKGTQGSAEGGQRYTGKADRATGGLLKSLFGVEFNPLNLNENERKALIIAGLGMMSHGDVGRGGLQGMGYLAGVAEADRESATAAAKLAYEKSKDEKDLALRTRAENRQQGSADFERDKFRDTQKLEGDKFGFEKDKFKSTSGLEDDKFAYNVGNDAEKLAWEKEKQKLDAGKPTDDLKEYSEYSKQEQAAGRTPETFLAYQMKLKQAGRPQTNVNVSGDKKGAEEMAKLHAKQYADLRTNADGAQTLADNLDAIEGALKQGVNTGMFGDWEQQARKFGAALGIGDIEKVAAGDLVQTISNRMALQVRAPGGESGGMPGAMSDADRTFLKETVPGLLKTPGGNEKLIGIMRAAAQRHLAIHELAIDYAEEHDGQLDAGFDRVVRNYVKANPLSKSIATTPRAEDQPRSVKTETIGLPPIGTVVKGHRFLGGNPSSQGSWERVAP